MKQNDHSILFVQSAIPNHTYFVLLQLLFVFVFGMFFVNYVLTKPLHVEQLDGKLGLFEREAELEHLLVNETSQGREKRDIVEGLRSLCPGKHRVLSNPPSGCVQSLLYCRIGDKDLIEPQCGSHSLACLPSISRFGFPKCKPVYKWMYITLRNGRQKILKLIKKCTCA